MYLPPGVQVLLYLGSVPRSGTTGSQTGFPRCRQTVPCRSWASFLPWHSFAEEVAVLLDLMLLWVPLNSYPPNSREVEGSRKFEFKAGEGTSLWGGRNSTGDLESSFCLCQMVNSPATAILGWLGGWSEPRRWCPAWLMGLSLLQLCGSGREGLPRRAESQVSPVPGTCPMLPLNPLPVPGWLLLLGGGVLLT